MYYTQIRANALASALRKLDEYSRRLPLQASPSTAHLFIVAPFLGVSGVNLANLFSTHPPIARRIALLKEMAYQSAGVKA